MNTLANQPIHPHTTLEEVKNDGVLGPGQKWPTRQVPQPGMTTRTWLAGIAMEGILSGDILLSRIKTMANERGSPEETPDLVAKIAIAYADSLLAELAKS